MAYQTLACCFIIWCDVVLFHMCNHTVKNIFILWNSKCTITVLNNCMRTSGIKTCNDSSFFISTNWKLCLITIMIRIVHPDQWFHWKLCKSTYPFQMATKFLFFEHFLFLIRNSLELAATTLTGRQTHWFYAVWRWFQDLHQSSITVILFGFHDLSCNSISNDCVFYKNSEAISFANAFTICSAIHNL